MGSWKAIITVLSPRSEWFVLAGASIRPWRIFGGSRSLIGVAGLTERCFSGRRWSRGSSEILLVVPRALGRLRLVHHGVIGQGIWQELFRKRRVCQNLRFLVETQNVPEGIAHSSTACHFHLCAQDFQGSGG